MTTELAGSSEKAERSRSGVQAAVWSETQSWRGPLREYARISAMVRATLENDSTDNSAIERRIQFLDWEIATLIEKHRPTVRKASELLNQIFFQELRFSIGEPSARRAVGDHALFDTVLATRTGPPGTIAILYAWVSETVARAYGPDGDFARVELVQSTPTEVVRLIGRTDFGSVWLVDLANNGEKISEEVWASWCSRHSSSGFCRIGWVQGLTRSLVELFKSFERHPAPTIEILSAQLFVLDRIIALQPSETSRWAERAVLNARRGDHSGALCDLKRFFAFHERETAPPAIVTLFDELQNR